MAKISKVIVPAAGKGTRFLPFSQIIAKELWPLADKPALQYIITEAVNSGIKEFIFVTRPGKEMFLDYFNVPFSQVEQKKQLGDGHAVLQAEKMVKKEATAVLFGDDIVESKKPALSQLIKVFNKYQKPVVALYRLPKEKFPSYGMVRVEKISKRVYKIKDIVEKPSIEKAPSDLAIVGKYIITPAVFNFLKKSPKVRGEIRLAGAFKEMIKKGEAIYGCEIEGKWLECGNIPSYLKSNLYFIKKYLAGMAEQKTR